jgi:hypothetical protein
MDRNIVSIKLEVMSEEFEGTVAPSPEWKGFPGLAAVRNGGKKEYYTVTLKRKQGVVDGKYRISLRLFNGNDRSQEFKSVDLNERARLSID